MELGDRATLCLWCFDLLHLNGIRLMPMPLDQRKAMLADVVTLVDSERMQFSGSFEDPVKTSRYLPEDEAGRHCLQTQGIRVPIRHDQGVVED
jgi:ATP-dependent DNA ligase